MPIYKISVDEQELNKTVNALKKLVDDYQLLEHIQDGDRAEIYKNEQQALFVNRDSGRIEYFDLTKFHTGQGVKQLDKKQLLKQAQVAFEQYLPESILKNTYFYRFYEYFNRSTPDGKIANETSYQAGISLNPVINGLPVIGPGGKYSIHLTHDGAVANIDLQFFTLTPSDVSELGVPAVPEGVTLFHSEQALQKLEQALQKDEISLEDHTIYRKELGYFFTTKRASTKWLVPSYAFFIEPNEGVIDTKRVYIFPASDDPAALKADESNRQKESERKKPKINERINYDDIKRDAIGNIGQLP